MRLWRFRYLSWRVRRRRKVLRRMWILRKWKAGLFVPSNPLHNNAALAIQRARTRMIRYRSVLAMLIPLKLHRARRLGAIIIQVRVCPGWLAAGCWLLAAGCWIERVCVRVWLVVPSAGGGFGLPGRSGATCLQRCRRLR